MTSFPILVVVLVVLYLMIYGQLGTSYGIQNLFWHEHGSVRSWHGATLLLGLIGTLAFNLDPHPRATYFKAGKFLGEPGRGPQESRADKHQRRIGETVSRPGQTGRAGSPRGRRPGPARRGWGWGPDPDLAPVDQEGSMDQDRQEEKTSKELQVGEIGFWLP